MSLFDARLLNDTRDLISLYNRNPRFQRIFDSLLQNYGNKATFRGRFLKNYVEFMARVAPKTNIYKQYADQFRVAYGKDAKAQTVKELFTRYYQEKAGLRNLDEINRQLETEAEQAATSPDDQLVTDPQKKANIQKAYQKKEQPQPQEQKTPEPNKLTKVTPKAPEIPAQPTAPSVILERSLAKGGRSERIYQSPEIASPPTAPRNDENISASPVKLARNSFINTGLRRPAAKLPPVNIPAGNLAQKSTFFNPWVLVGLGVGLLIIFLIPGGLLKNTTLFPPYDQSGLITTGEAADLLTIKKTGSPTVAKKGQIDYQLTVTYKGPGTANVKVTDILPDKASFKDTGNNNLCNTSETGSAAGQTVTWNLNNLTQNNPKTVCVSVTAPDEDIYLVNKVRAEATPSASGGNLELLQSGPASLADTNTPITYALKMTYKGAGSITFDVTDQLSNLLGEGSTDSLGSCNSNVSGSYDTGTNLASWKNIQLKQNESKTLCLTAKPKPEADKKSVDNTFKAMVTNVNLPAAGGTGVVRSSNFEEIVKGQGRNVNILGDEDAFISQVMQNGKKYGFADKSTQLHQIYQAAVQKNINPLFVTILWGVEATFSINNTEFGCKPFRNGFATQLQCSVKTLDYWIGFFEKQNSNSTLTIQGTSCSYNDPFSFAYEKYAPVCAVYDSNEAARTNFIKYYQQLTQTKP